MHVHTERHINRYSLKGLVCKTKKKKKGKTERKKKKRRKEIENKQEHECPQIRKCIYKM